jgi:2',3'-cyclic-nucleotide 2'-phosphodiesterase (5'-nucleotidase family)
MALSKLGDSLLLLDAGNALFPPTVQPDKKLKDRATFVLNTMGKLGTRAMAAGHKDLWAGVGFLEETAKKAGVPVLSANLKVNDKLKFPGSLVVTVNGIKVGIVGVSPPGPVPSLQGVVGGPTAPAVKEELKKFPADVQLKVVLAATPYGDAMELAGQLKGSVDLILQSHDMHPGGMQAINHNFIAAAGERGRWLEVLTLKVDGTGDFENLDEAERSKELLARAEQNLTQLQDRRKAADGEWAKQQLEQTIIEMTARRDELKKQVAKTTAKGARTISSRTQDLDASLGDDPEILKQTQVIEPPGSQQHP